jgi:CRP/FNR family transcriptional regulator, anaerobic regulatory protein
MYEQIIKQISYLINLDSSETTCFTNKLNVKKTKKKEFLLIEGDICKYVYFINSGCLRYFYLVDGVENTGQFFFENGWYTDYHSFLSGKPTKQNVEALEDCEILFISKIDLQQLFVEVPKFEKFGRIMAENAFLGVRYKNEMLTNQNAEQRYLTLIKERPKVFERIPQHYIASYLGIKPPSLSRIRNKLANKY